MCVDENEVSIIRYELLIKCIWHRCNAHTCLNWNWRDGTSKIVSLRKTQNAVHWSKSNVTNHFLSTRAEEIWTFHQEASKSIFPTHFLGVFESNKAVRLIFLIVEWTEKKKRILSGTVTFAWMWGLQHTDFYLTWKHTAARTNTPKCVCMYVCCMCNSMPPQIRLQVSSVFSPEWMKAEQIQ